MYEVYIFLYGSNSKANSLAQLEFEVAYYDVVVQHVLCSTI